MLPQAAESKRWKNGRQKNILNENILFSAFNTFKTMKSNKRKFNNHCDFFKSILLVRGGHSDYSPLSPLGIKNPGMLLCKLTSRLQA
jgi:hypothetical protein